jgi:hypothetical protein
LRCLRRAAGRITGTTGPTPAAHSTKPHPSHIAVVLATHVAIIGHVEELRADPDLADIDQLSRHYTGKPYPRRNRGRVTAWIAVDGWHGWGAHKDSSQPG